MGHTAGTTSVSGNGAGQKFGNQGDESLSHILSSIPILSGNGTGKH